MFLVRSSFAYPAFCVVVRITASCETLLYASMQSKNRVGIIFGGKSAEHEVSVRSAMNIIAALDTAQYEPVCIGITKSGVWILIDQPIDTAGSLTLTPEHGRRIAFVPQGNGALVYVDGGTAPEPIAIAFPILHGPFGEDGTVQGLLKIAGVPFVGASVLGAAVGMDKDVMKRLLRDAGIPIGKFLTCTQHTIPSYADAVAQLGTPLFIKPANMGSSVGVSKVMSSDAYTTALETAFRYDTKVLIEEAIVGREIECAVLGNDNPRASVPGEITPHHDFYSYEAKYLDEHGASLHIPAQIPLDVTQCIQALSIRTFQALSCAGLGRVDFFLQPDGNVLVNEINTLPGFTSISMYPKLWEATGISYTPLITALLQLARERFEQEQSLSSLRHT